jgi:hypothetical protein
MFLPRLTRSRTDFLRRLTTISLCLSFAVSKVTVVVDAAGNLLCGVGPKSNEGVCGDPLNTSAGDLFFLVLYWGSIFLSWGPSITARSVSMHK